MSHIERQYYPAWARVRDNRPSEVTIIVHPRDTHTVRRMIRKEKNDDLAFKVECDHAGLAWKLEFTVTPLTDEKVRIKYKLIKYMPLRTL